ncbi:MAG: hypothetical protein A2W99_04410 [Bacteroidetes bacterium GWF2_33_16]|nr:MAG: hypothetical protein A2X00_16930 [Bacteroidetes bacterium GWE2_32_14]OFY05914.1 MAG: hypothetical protein A2W99_04410 [Bacteroidetes bacterium GWF2_33_16]
MYIPANTNIPLLDKKGEKQVDFYLSTTGAQLTGNYAFSDKYAIMATSSFSYKNFSDYYDFWDYVFDGTSSESSFFDESEFAHHYNEIGFGRYNIFDSRIKGELFCGIGYGVAKDKLSSDDYIVTYSYSNEYWLGFVQYNFGRRFRKVDIGGGIRVGYSAFSFTFPDEDLPILVYTTDNFNNFFIEPSFIVKFGNENIKFVIRAGGSLVKTWDFDNNIETTKGMGDFLINTTSVHISFGINFNF